MQQEVTDMLKPAILDLTQEWDKTFPKSDDVDHKKVTFINRYGITLAADQYTPKKVSGRLPAIAVCGPFGAVKEQCSGLYAQTLAERGFLTIAFDPSFTGESGGNPRFSASIPKSFRQPWISSVCRTTWIHSRSVSLESAAGAVWH